MIGVVRRALLALAVCCAFSSPALAQEKTGMKPGFLLKPGTAKIVLMRPSIKVGEQSTGGMFEPNADWTAQARENLTAAIGTIQAKLGSTVVAYDEPIGQAATSSAEYQSLFTTVADSVREFQFFPGNRLPTKKRDKTAFEWTVGKEIAALPGLEGADYVLFITTEDQFGSAGRKVLQVFAMLASVPVTSGVHLGYAGLIDLKSGDLVWLNADQQMGGDPRTPEGAEKRVAQLFEGFPGRPSEPVTTASK